MRKRLPRPWPAPAGPSPGYRLLLRRSVRLPPHAPTAKGRAAAAPRLLASLCGLSALAAHPLVLGRSPQTTRSRRHSQCRLPRRSSPPKPPTATPSKAVPCAPGAVCHAAAPRAGLRRRSFLCGRRAAAPNGPARRRSREALHSPLAARARERRSWTCGGGSEGVEVSVGGFAGLLLGWLGVESYSTLRV